MKLLARKTMAVTTATLMMLSVFANTANVFGLDYGEGSPLPSLYKTDKYDTKTAEEVIRDTYWANLEEGSVKGKFRNLILDDRGVEVIIGKDQNESSQLLEMVAKDLRGSISKGVFPKYLLKPNETALKDLPIDVDQFWDVQNLLSTGITDSNLGVMDSATYMLSSLGYHLGDTVNIVGSRDYGKNASDPISDKVNPYKFKESDLISQDEINNPKKLTVYADIKKTGDSDSSAIGTFEQEEEVKLDFLLKGDWIRRFVMGYTLNITREYDNEEMIKGIFERMYGMIDSQLVYTIDIPNEVEVKNPSAKISGLDGFKVTTDVKDESGNKKLVVSLRLDESIQGKKLKWSETIEKIKKLDTSNPVLSISGLYVKSTVNPDTKVTLKASLGGYVDWATKGLAQGIYYKANKPVGSENPDSWDDYTYEPDLSRYDNTYEAYNRTYLYFVGKQSDAGRDQAAPADKPNLISYTFKVKKKENKPVEPKKSDNTNTGRIDGKDRIETAINISKKNYDRAKTVIVVRHDLFPDSMTASVLAKLKDAPILLNPTDKLDSRVGDEIKRLGAEEVIIVGGQNSVSERVREDLKAYDADKNVERIAGADRYGTSEMVAKRVVGITGKKNTGVVASGQVFPDALSVGTFASREGYPILLVKKDSVPSQIQNAIKDLDINKTYIAGGLNTISKSTEAKLPNVVERMAGNTRYETSVAIAKSKFGASKEAYIASGEEFADALVISPISGKFNRPTLLVSRNKNSNSPVKTYIRNAGFTSITAIGGERFVPYSVLEDLVK
ncbi:cell wall-binding repeat-containing protein [Peptostreptococcus stomatis]|uniref:cell wall-binding repeat-containing protein n=1 Tax=Peptostreptococcus stomatis TaxID=341694 RepID=UPI0026EEDEFC|nr:cell wall-binding repeat-containing protein [Peptostreptococcus stomatis]